MPSEASPWCLWRAKQRATAEDQPPFGTADPPSIHSASDRCRGLRVAPSLLRRLARLTHHRQAARRPGKGDRPHVPHVNPTLDFNSPAGGRYDTWIGSFAPRASVSGTLYVTEDTYSYP